ncbi:MAG: immune inhibitor A, partial [Candidatus Methanoperedens sp.]|nr:immune inhibitor A [Candidatus Methanoperedens sp.]
MSSILQEKPVITEMASIKITSVNNYTTVLKIGQTPQQLGFTFSSGSITGWQWWDVNGFGTDQQKNIVLINIYNNTSGTIKPVSGLVSLSTWPMASYRKYGGTYSYKADTDPSPISTQNNYPDQTEIWMVKSVNLTGATNPSLSFQTWYSMESNFDYGYVAVSDDGNSWTNLPGTVTTNTDPNGNNLGNGITGNSSGNWVQETMDLTPYEGTKILLGFRFISDQATNDEGWYIDNITVSGGVLNDDAETPNDLKTLSVNVTYPNLTISGATDPLTPLAKLQYYQRIQQVPLKENLEHPGTYYGYFTYAPFAQQYPGNYIVNLDAAIDGTQISATSQFQTTNYGCQSCHNKKLAGNLETSYVHGEGGGMQSCTFVCHAGSRGLYGDGFMGPPIDANPMHVHEMIYGHQGGYLDGAYYTQPPYNVQAHVNVSCEQCHTSFIHDNAGSDISSIWNYFLYGTNITYSSGTHESLTCKNCHGDLTYPDIPQNQYELTGTLGNYTPEFTSSRSFTDTFVIEAEGTENITISVIGDSDKRIALYVIGPVDNTTTGLQGPCEYGNPCYIAQNLPMDLDVLYPFKGKWLANLILLQSGTVNYTITSSSPIERKPIIKIPDCNTCHNSEAIDDAFTTDQIPKWNPGFAHVDTNNDGTLDIQCRMCHDAMHNININKCQTCHTRAPTNHPISDPSFSQYSQSQCLSCHGDPHKVTASGGGCVGCHSSPGTRYYVDTSLFAGHANLNTSDGPNNVTDADCMTCHFRSSEIIMSPDAGLGAANHSNTYFCDDCHTTGGSVPIKPADPAL